jgi:signal transduction histidine kinase/HPt (histidine-containing phosphotransfer) domain-containing protein/ActR/RegA family two-component response regulator
MIETNDLQEQVTELQQQLKDLKEQNKKLKVDLRASNRETAAIVRQLHVMEMSFNSRNVMYRTQIADNELQRRYLTSFMKNSQSFVLFLDEYSRIAFISKKLLLHIGVEFEEAVSGLYISEFYAKYFDQNHASVIMAAIDDVSVTRESVNRSVTLKCSQGEERHYSVVCNPMSDEEKHLWGMIVIYYDETDILKAMKQAVEANNAKSRFLATMSHEIRTPMNAIIGVADIELARENHERHTLESFEVIYRSAQSLLGIINDILDLSKAETGKLEIVSGVFEFASLLNDTIQLNIVRIGSKPIVFELRFEGDIPGMLIGDELRIKQILNNVLSNAFKYTDAGSVKLTVRSVISGDKAEMTFVIADTGQGMREEDLKMLFDEYSRFNQIANRKTEGTGLGMNITHRLIALMNGNISAESEFGKGSTFTIRLPLQTPPNVKYLPEKVKNALETFKFHASSTAQTRIAHEYMPYGRVLLVDDVETNLFVAEGLMSPYGIKCDKVTGGRKAIDLIERGNVYDVVFMDHMMPEMDGIEATRIIRSRGYTGTIIALTANALSGNDTMFKENGFDDFISKPIDIRLLDKALHAYVKARHPDECTKSKLNVVAAKKPAVSSSPAVNPGLLKVFLRDAANAVKILPDQLGKGDYGAFAITVHGMKSACANVNEQDCSALARELEFAAKEGNSAFITEKYPAFEASLKDVIARLTPQKESAGVNAEYVDPAEVKKLITALSAACDEYDSTQASVILAELQKMNLPEELNNLLADTDQKILHADFEDVVAMCEDAIANALTDVTGL